MINMKIGLAVLKILGYVKERLMLVVQSGYGNRLGIADQFVACENRPQILGELYSVFELKYCIKMVQYLIIQNKLSIC